MSCNCVPNIINNPPDGGNPTSHCDECLKIVNLRYSCTDGPTPCGGAGGTLVVNLAQYNDDMSACGCAVKYSLINDYDVTEFTSVTITEAGVLTIVTSDAFTEWKEMLIKYKVDCPCGILSGTGHVYVCKKNNCVGVECNEGFACDQCTASCEEMESDLELGGEVSVL